MKKKQGSGGIAGVGVLCTAMKAKGTTGSSDPRGDPFSVDYVAHEVSLPFHDCTAILD